MALLTVRQAAERLRVAATTVYALCATKKLAHVRVGIARGVIRIPEESVTAYLAGATIEPNLSIDSESSAQQPPDGSGKR